MKLSINFLERNNYLYDISRNKTYHSLFFSREITTIFDKYYLNLWMNNYKRLKFDKDELDYNLDFLPKRLLFDLYEKDNDGNFFLSNSKIEYNKTSGIRKLNFDSDINLLSYPIKISKIKIKRVDSCFYELYLFQKIESESSIIKFYINKNSRVIRALGLYDQFEKDDIVNQYATPSIKEIFENEIINFHIKESDIILEDMNK